MTQLVGVVDVPTDKLIMNTEPIPLPTPTLVAVVTTAASSVASAAASASKSLSPEDAAKVAKWGQQLKEQIANNSESEQTRVTQHSRECNPLFSP